MYLAAYQVFKLPPCLPALLDAYQYDRTLAGAFMSVYAAAGLALSMPLGRVVERRGVIVTTVASLALMIIGNILGLAAPERGLVMLGARALEGVAFAGLAITGPVVANRSATPTWLPLIVSLTAIWIPVGQLMATLIAPFALVRYGWSALWWPGIAASLVLGIWSFRLKRNHLFHPSTPTDHSTARERGTSLSTMERRHLMVSAVIFTIFATQYFAYMTWLPQYLVEAQGLSLAQSIAGYTLPIVMVLVFSLVTAGLLRAGIHVGRLMTAGMAILATVWWFVPVSDGGTGGIVSLIMYGIGAGVTPTCLFAMPAVITGPRGPTAPAFAIIMTGRNVGVLIGPVMLAQIFSMTGSWTYIAPVFAVTTTAGFVIGIWLTRGVSRAHRMPNGGFPKDATRYRCPVKT